MVLLAGLSLSGEAGIITNPLTQKLGYKKIIKENSPRSTGGWEAESFCKHTPRDLHNESKLLLGWKWAQWARARARGPGGGRRAGTPGERFSSGVPPASALHEQARECQEAVEIYFFFAESERCACNRWRENGGLRAGKCQPVRSAPICWARKLSLGRVRGGSGWFQVAREQDEDARHLGTSSRGADLGSGLKAGVVRLAGWPIGGLPPSSGRVARLPPRGIRSLPPQ